MTRRKGESVSSINQRFSRPLLHFSCITFVNWIAVRPRSSKRGRTRSCNRVTFYFLVNAVSRTLHFVDSTSRGACRGMVVSRFYTSGKSISLTVVYRIPFVSFPTEPTFPWHSIFTFGISVDVLLTIRFSTNIQYIPAFSGHTNTLNLDTPIIGERVTQRFLRVFCFIVPSLRSYTDRTLSVVTTNEMKYERLWRPRRRSGRSVLVPRNLFLHLQRDDGEPL